MIVMTTNSSTCVNPRDFRFLISDLRFLDITHSKTGRNHTGRFAIAATMTILLERYRND